MTIQESFGKNYKKLGSGCWEWSRALDGRGYGKLYIGGGRANPQYVAAHRFSYEREFGPIPEGIHVCHRCDNPPCVRPNHLFLGTNAENRRDSVNKGRAAHGEGHGLAKLRAEDIERIRDMWSIKRSSQREIARYFGISQTQVSRIVNGQRWAA